jgi:hypothetical protein
MTQEARGEDACIVDDQQIAGAKVIWQPRERGVFDCARFAPEHQQSRLPSLGRRALSDQLLGQIEVEIAGSQ